MTKYCNSFYTQHYKAGYIHTWIDSKGCERVQAQIDTTLYNNAKTVIGAKRWITKQITNTTF